MKLYQTIAITLGIVFLVASSASMLTGCGTVKSTPLAERSGAELWSQACMRCHNFRDVSSLSDTEWDIATHHMRIRGNLTAIEHEKIAEFLKASN